MSERTSKFSADLDRLIKDGEMLLWAMRYESEPEPEALRATLLEVLEGKEEALDPFIVKLPDFNRHYQSWYSEAQAVIRQVLPNRLADFTSYFENPRPRKEIDFQNYMIRDYLQGLQIVGDRTQKVIVDGSSAIPEFRQQLNIVRAAKATLESSLMDLKSVLQADLFDSEIETAEALANAGYLRATGAICGVVLEKHLHHVCDIHEIKFSKKNPGISDLIQFLKDGNVITVAQWRFIQSLADIRNLCDHAKGREPTKDEIADLVGGTTRTLKQVF